MPVAAACTIISPNYLSYARTLASSYLRQHPGHRFFVLLVAAVTDAAAFASQPFETVLLEKLPISDLAGLAFQYDLLELNTNVKPTFLRYLFAQHSLDILTYLDPDIFVYAPLAPVFAALADHDAVLTPHITSPINDDLLPSEQDILYNGTYNLGFIALRNTPAADAILAWWERRCLALGFSEGRSGLFVDQKWMNLAPGLFPNVAILRHPGCNMAYWNLHERSLAAGPNGPALTNHLPLIFFHFSGFTPTNPAVISKNTNRLTSRPDLTELLAEYAAAVLANSGTAGERVAYGFNTMSDGTAITRLARRLYAANRAAFPGQDPFDAQSSFARFARAERLIAGPAPPAPATWSEFSGSDRRVALVHHLLRFTLRILGPHRYELLMRYLAFISVLRNQAAFLKPKGGASVRSVEGSKK